MAFGRRKLSPRFLGAVWVGCAFAVHADESCLKIAFRKTDRRWAWRSTPFAVRAFDSEKFLAAKAQYLNRVEPAALKAPVTFEERLAFFEVASRERLGITDGIENEKTLKAYFRALKREFPLSEAKLRESIDLIYLATHADPTSLGYIRAGGARSLRTWERDMLYQRIVNDVTAHNAAELLGPEGLLRSSKLLEKFGPYGQYRDLQEGAVTVLLNGTVAATPDFYGVAPPSFQFLKRRRTPPHLIEKALNEGFDSVYDEMKELYGKEAQFDFYWEWARRSWAGVFAGLYLLDRQHVYEAEDLEEAQAKKLEEVQRQSAVQMIRKRIEDSTKIDINARLLKRWEKTYVRWFEREYKKKFSDASSEEKAIYERDRAAKIKALYAK